MLRAIIIDAGHGLSPDGQIDNGAQGITSERTEVLQIVEELYNGLFRSVVGIPDLNIYTVNSGLMALNDEKRMKLSDQVSRINAILKARNYAADEAIVISIHCNAGGASGVEAWFKSKDRNSEELANALVAATVYETGLPNRGAKGDLTNRLGRLSIVRDVNCTSCLLECGFVDNKNDAAILMDSIKDDAFGKGIMKGISDYSGISFNPNMISPFSDVPNTHFAYDAIRRCADAKLITGYADRTFHPDQPMTRAEVCVLIDRLKNQ